MKRKIVGGDEQDVFTGWRRAYYWTKHPGVCKKVKRRANRRERHSERQNLKVEKWRRDYE